MAVPGGFIYVYKGLTDLMKTDDELAGVIGHELGHIVERHSVHQMEKTLGMTLLLGGLFKDNSVVLQSLALNVIMAGYSRSDEKKLITWACTFYQGWLQSLWNVDWLDETI